MKEGKKKEYIVSIRLDEQTKKEIHAEARRNGRTFSGECAWILKNRPRS